MKKVILKIILFYQYVFSRNLLKALSFGINCRYIPTCSEYTFQAVKRYGTIKGLILGLKRILRCHPFSKGGIDLVK